jgi:peptide/nickel transport system substrate-binding protein
VLVRNDGYWGPKTKLDRLIIRPIADTAARLQALQTGEIQAYDNAEPQDVKTIQKDPNLRVISRPPLNVGYVGFNQKSKLLKNPLVRQAIAYGLDRASVVKSFYAGRGVVAQEFQPPGLFGYNPNVVKYPYNPAKAKALLQKAGLKLPVTLNFWYPTDVSRAYAPDSKRNFQAFSASLDKSGFKVVPHSAPWRPDYTSRANAGTLVDIYLYGWNADFADPDNFLGTFFQQYTPQFGFKDSEIFDLLNKAERETNQSKRVALYKQANAVIMKYLPGVPYVNASGAIAAQKSVQGYVPSPVILDDFQLMSLAGQ